VTARSGFQELAMFVLLPFAIAFVCAVVWNVSYPRFLARLRVTHPAAWDALGQPRYVEWRRQARAATIRFLLRGDYTALNDAQLTSLGRWARMSLFGAVAGALAFASGGLFVVYAQG
jgi:hypothetical protein